MNHYDELRNSHSVVLNIWNVYPVYKDRFIVIYSSTVEFALYIPDYQ